jgi:hypothetical protein
MKDKIFYACEGIIIGYIGHHIWNDVLIPIIISAACAIITLLVQFFGKRFLNSFYNKKLPPFRENGRGK